MSHEADLAKLAEIYKDISTKRIKVVEKLKSDQLTAHINKLKSVFSTKKTWLTQQELAACQSQTRNIIRAAIQDKLAEIAEEDSQKTDEKRKCLQKYNQDLAKASLESSTAVQCVTNAFERMKELNIQIWNVKVFPENVAYIGMALEECHVLMELWCSYKSWFFLVSQVQDMDCDGGILSSQLYFRDDFCEKPISLHCDFRCQNTGKAILELLLNFFDNYTTLEAYVNDHYKVRIDLPRVLESRGVEISKVDFKWTFTKLKLGDDVGFRFYYPDQPTKSLWIKASNHNSNQLFVSSSKYGSYESSRISRTPNIPCLDTLSFRSQSRVEHLLTEKSTEDMADQIVTCLNFFTGRYGFRIGTTWYNGADVDPMIDRMLTRIVTKCQTPNLLNIVRCTEGPIDLKTGLVIHHIVKFNLYDQDHLIGGSFVKSNRLPWIRIGAYLVGRVGQGQQGYLQVKLMQAIGQVGELDSHFDHYDGSEVDGQRVMDACKPTIYEEVRSVGLDPVILAEISRKRDENPEAGWGMAEERDVPIGILEEVMFKNQDPRVCARDLFDRVETLVCQFLPESESPLSRLQDAQP